MAEAQRLHISTDLDDAKGRARLEIRLKIFNIVEYVPVLDQLGDLEEAKQLDELEETEVKVGRKGRRGGQRGTWNEGSGERKIYRKPLSILSDLTWLSTPVVKRS